MQNRLNIIHGGTIASMVDLGGSLAVASKGLYATGVSTDLNGEPYWTCPLDNDLESRHTDIGPSVTYLSSGGKVGDKIQATAVCEKSGCIPALT